MRPRGQPGASVVPRMHRTQKTNISQGNGMELATNLAASRTSTYSNSGILQGHKPPTSATLSVGLTTQPHWPYMDPMKKDIKERAFFAKYISIVNEVEDDQFVNKALVRENMRQRYKGAKKDHTAQSLWRKYEQELTLLRTFAKKIPGIGNLAELPSGSTQLRHMIKPLIQSLWKEKNPVRR